MSQITPKALTALQKLLTMNIPQDQNNQPKSLLKSNHNFSGSQQSKDAKSLTKRFNNLIINTQVPIRNSIAKSSNSDVKNELIHALKKPTKKSNNSLNAGKHSSAPFNKKEPQLSERDSYKKKRPPQLIHLDEENIHFEQSDVKQVQSAKNANQIKKSPINFHGELKYASGFFTSNNSRSNGMNVFGSLNEVLRQYIQTKSQIKCIFLHNIEAGTGEGVKICQSARNAEKKVFEKQQAQNYISEKKLPPKSPSQNNSPTKTLQYGEMLQELYLKTNKILSAYQTKETLWKRQKQSLRDEVRFLKQLLKHQEELNFQQKPPF